MRIERKDYFNIDKCRTYLKDSYGVSGNYNCNELLDKVLILRDEIDNYIWYKIEVEKEEIETLEIYFKNTTYAGSIETRYKEVKEFVQYYLEKENKLWGIDDYTKGELLMFHNYKSKEEIVMDLYENGASFFLIDNRRKYSNSSIRKLRWKTFYKLWCSMLEELVIKNTVWGYESFKVSEELKEYLLSYGCRTLRDVQDFYREHTLEDVYMSGGVTLVIEFIDELLLRR